MRNAGSAAKGGDIKTILIPVELLLVEIDKQI